jgi:formiminoglutamase
MSLSEDPNWPRASAWLSGAFIPGQPAARLSVLGAPLRLGSITPGRCDLAPTAIRRALERYSPYDVATGRDLRAVAARDQGDLDVAALGPEAAYEPIHAAVRSALSHSHAVVMLGGDNSITRPGVRALGGDCGLLTFDAHFDLRDADRGLTNGNPIRALLGDGMPGNRIVQIGIQSFANSRAYTEIARAAGIKFYTVDCVRARGIEAIVREAFELLAGRSLYVDLDVDVLDRAYSPATPGSRPGGLHPGEIRRAAHLCGANPRVRAMDLVEVDPEKDINDTTCLAAASFLLEFASGLLER